MTDKHDAEQPAEHSAEETAGATAQQGHAPEPWWAGTGPRGAVALIVLGAAVAALVFLAPAAGLTWLPFVPDIPASGYYQAAKVAAIGLVILATTAFTRRTRSASSGRPPKRKQPRDG